MLPFVHSGIAPFIFSGTVPAISPAGDIVTTVLASTGVPPSSIESYIVHQFGALSTASANRVSTHPSRYLSDVFIEAIIQELDQSKFVKPFLAVPTTSNGREGIAPAASDLTPREMSIIQFACAMVYEMTCNSNGLMRLLPYVVAAVSHTDTMTSNYGYSALTNARLLTVGPTTTTCIVNQTVHLVPSRAELRETPSSFPSSDCLTASIPRTLYYTGQVGAVPNVAFVLSSPVLRELCIYLRIMSGPSITQHKCAVLGLSAWAGQYERIAWDYNFARDPVAFVDAIVNATRQVIPEASVLPPSILTQASPDDDLSFLMLVSLHAKSFAAPSKGAKPKPPVLPPLVAIITAAASATLHDPYPEVRSSARMFVYIVATMVLRPPTRYPVFSIETDALAVVDDDGSTPDARALAAGTDLIPSRAYKRLVKLYQLWAGSTPCDNRSSPQQLSTSHAGLLGLCALVESHKADLPPHLPPILAFLAPHATAPSPLGTLVKETFASFRQSHMDAWERFFKRWITPTEMDLITSVDYAPSYVA